MTIPLNSRWRILKGPRAGHILQIGRRIQSAKYPEGHLQSEYWAMNENLQTKGKVKLWALQDSCEPLP